MNMRLIGARTISEIVPEMVDASALRMHVGVTPTDNLFNQTCEYCLLSDDPSLKIIMIYRSTPRPRRLQGLKAVKQLVFEEYMRARPFNARSALAGRPVAYSRNQNYHLTTVEYIIHNSYL